MNKESLKKVLVLVAIFMSLVANLGTAHGNQSTVFVIPIHGDIELGVAKHVQRGLTSAKQTGAQAIIIEIDTFGGRVDAATKIRDLIIAQDIPVIAFVRNRAWSAGALIALSADQIVMMPGSSIGAAEPRLGAQTADEKLVAALRSDFEAAAERRGIDSQLAAAMVDARIDIPNVVTQGQLLSLSAEKALDLGLADGIRSNIDGVLELNDLQGAQTRMVQENWGEKLSRIVTNPIVSPLLLAIGFFGLVFEALTPGWAVGGSVGLFALGLYFAGHLMAGVAGWEAIALFIVGLILIALEILVVPGVGITGTLGLVALIISIFLASTSGIQAVISLIVAFVLTVIATYLSIRFLRTKRNWSQLVLDVKLDEQSGYVSFNSLQEHVGKAGETVTPLRPAGSAKFGEVLLDVVSEGGYIEKDVKVKVLKVEGGRIVVRPFSE